MIVYLNVGGTVYTTTSDTLNNDGGGYLSILVRNQSTEGRVENTLSKDGNIFIDRNGTLFEYILDFLRNGRLPSRLSDVLLVDLRDEAMFYQIPELVQLLEDKLVTGKNAIIAAVSASNNNCGPQFYKNIEYVNHMGVHVEWPDDLPLEQRVEGGYGHGLPISEYNPETSEKISLYYLNKGYKIIDTITKDEGFTECPHGHGPNVKDTRCTHSHVQRISAPRKYHVLQKL